MNPPVLKSIGRAVWFGLVFLNLVSFAVAGKDSAVADSTLVQAVVRGDKKVAEALLLPEFSVTDRFGKTRGQAAILMDLRNLSTGDADLVPHEYGQVAYLTGTGQTNSGKIRIVRVWVKKENKWLAILQQDTLIVGKTASAQATVPAGTLCENPCKSVPYKTTSAEALAVVASWEALEDAVNHRDADGWARHVADEFVFNVKEDGNPLTKNDRMAIIRKQSQGNTVTDIGTVVPDSMKVWVFGDSAVMSDVQQPTQGGPPYQAMRIWVKREGRWQLVYSQQTVIEGAQVMTH